MTVGGGLVATRSRAGRRAHGQVGLSVGVWAWTGGLVAGGWRRRDAPQQCSVRFGVGKIRPIREAFLVCDQSKQGLQGRLRSLGGSTGALSYWHCGCASVVMRLYCVCVLVVFSGDHGDLTLACVSA